MYHAVKQAAGRQAGKRIENWWHVPRSNGKIEKMIGEGWLGGWLAGLTFHILVSTAVRLALASEAANARPD